MATFDAAASPAPARLTIDDPASLHSLLLMSCPLLRACGPLGGAGRAAATRGAAAAARLRRADASSPSLSASALPADALGRAVDAAAATLPIGELLPAICASLDLTPNLVLEAPPGAGKTSLVPLALLRAAASAGGWAASGRLLVLEPRRLAAKAAARRMASLLGERVGHTVGFTVRGESEVSPGTRVEVLTTGVLLRRLQRDPGLDGCAGLLLDEVHERGVEMDTALALARHSQRLLRPDLRIVAMSATLGGSLGHALARVLGDAPVLEARGRAWPVSVTHLPEPPSGRGELEEAVAFAVRRALAATEGCVLVFLPGAPEIRRVQRLLAALPVPVLPLYGDLRADEQEAALAAPPPGRRRVVLSSAVAESSLTVAGVRVVVDCGLSRRSAFNPATGLSRLVTVRTSAASAEQRAGRAGRTAPGWCFRLYSEAAGAQRPAQAAPEVLSADLAPLALELAVGGARPAELSWLDAPPEAGLAAATALLVSLGALEGGTGTPTPHGRRVAALGTHPRLAHMVLRGSAAGAPALATLLAAVLEEKDPLRRGDAPRLGGPGADVRLRVDALHGALRDGDPRLAGWLVDAPAAARVRDSAQLLRAQLRALGDDLDADRASSSAADAASVVLGEDAPSGVGLLLACAYPDRVARLRSGGGGAYTLASGKQAALDEHDPLARAGHDWLVAADVDGDVARPRVFAAAPLPQDCVSHPWIAPLVEDRVRVFWNPTANSAAAVRRGAAGVSGGGDGRVCSDAPPTLPLPRPAAAHAHPGRAAAVRVAAAHAHGRRAGRGHDVGPAGAPGAGGAAVDRRAARLARPRPLPRPPRARRLRRRPRGPAAAGERRGAAGQPGGVAGALSGGRRFEADARRRRPGRRAAVAAHPRPAALRGGGRADALRGAQVGRLGGRGRSLLVPLTLIMFPNSPDQPQRQQAAH